MQHYGDIAFTTEVKDRQRIDGSLDNYEQVAHQAPPGALGPNEQAFIRAADSFYVASVSSTGWPYIQHRGGPTGFVQIIDGTTIAWLERHGNRQHVTAGNLDHDCRVALFFMDYTNRARLKLYGHAVRTEVPPADDVERLGGGRTTGLLTVHVDAFDWNCSKYITERYTSDTVRAVIEPLERRIQELEAELAEHRTNLSAQISPRT